MSISSSLIAHRSALTEVVPVGRDNAGGGVQDLRQALDPQELVRDARPQEGEGGRQEARLEAMDPRATAHTLSSDT